MKKKITVSELDVKNLTLIRDNISRFLAKYATLHDNSNISLLDIAPQIHEGARAYFPKSQVFTLDIDVNSGADFIADMCVDNSNLIADNKFDIVVCTEVLEHTLQPFNAVDEIYRVLKPNGLTLVTVPFNFRIHGPLPDCWRFTEHGLRALFNKFKDVIIEPLESNDRDLMPIHYTLIARK